MIFIKYSKTNYSARYINFTPFDPKYGEKNPETGEIYTENELLEIGALVESLPEHTLQNGYDTLLCYNPETNEAYYRYTKSDALIGGEAITALAAEAIVFSGGDAAKSREVAAAIAEAAPMLTVRPWAVGMTTNPGEIVSDPDGKYNYMYSGATAKTHSNHTYYPGSNGVYYWAIIPKTQDGIKIYPEIAGIIVAVRKNEIWYNTTATKLYKWTGEDNNACNWYPGQAGVHQWEEVK